MPEFTYEEQDNRSILLAELGKTEIIDNMAMGMLTNNRIDGVLPFNFSQMEEKRYLKYDITEKQKLSHYFAGFVTREKFVSVLKNMVDTILTMEDYMLDETIFLLEADYIWIDSEMGKCCLTPVPLVQDEKENENRQKFLGFLKKLMFTIQFDQNENCDYVAKVISFINSGEFSLGEFKKILKEENEKGGEEVVTPMVSVIQQIPQQPAFIPKAIPLQITKKKGFFTKKEKLIKEKPIKEKPIKEKPIKVKQIKEKKKKAELSHDFSIPGVKQQNNPQIPTSVFGETTVLSQLEEGTTVLASSIPVHVPYLIRKKTNQKIMLTKQEFKIGKDSKVDFCITDNSAISRNHADILNRSGLLFIRDNDSTNHTYIDGTPLASGQEASLQHNSKIQLADEEFEVFLYESR